MRSEKRFWTSLAVLFLLAALLAPRSVTASSLAAMAVDAVPGGGIDSSRTVTGTDPFDVDIVITEATTLYQGYQYKLQWDAAVLAFDVETHLMPAELSLCPGAFVEGNTVIAGCVRELGVTTFTGPVSRATFHCLGAGTSPLHLISLAEDAAYGSSVLAAGGDIIETALADAQITCGAGGAAPAATATPGPSPTPGGPGGPVATPTPLPPGFEAVDLAAGCNPVTTTYPDGTAIETVAAAVGPAGNLESLWEFEGGLWLGYSPAYPQVSDLAAKNFLDVVFICVAGVGAFARPIV